MESLENFANYVLAHWKEAPSHSRAGVLYRAAQMDVQKSETQLTALQAVADAARDVVAQHYCVSITPRSYVVTDVDARNNTIAVLAAALEGLGGSV